MGYDGVEAVQAGGFVARHRRYPAQGYGNTAAEEHRGESLEQRIAQEVPDVGTNDDDWTEDVEDDEVGDARSGRLVASDDADDRYVQDVGIDGAGASAEEAAMHVIDEH